MLSTFNLILQLSPLGALLSFVTIFVMMDWSTTLSDLYNGKIFGFTDDYNVDNDNGNEHINRLTQPYHA